MLQQIDLRKLAQMQGNGRDFVSAYFPTEQGLDVLASRERAIRALLADEPLEQELFDANMKLVREVLENASSSAAANDSEAMCIFACTLLDFAEGYPISMPLAPQLLVGPAPHIRPLAELQDEYETFAVVACDNTRAQIFSVTNEKCEVEESIRGGIKNHVRKGGWSQQRYSRRRDNQLKHYADDVVEALGRMIEARQIDRIVLVGSTETMNEIERRLPPQHAEFIVGKEAFDLAEGEDEIVKTAYESYFADERQWEEDLWNEIKNQYRKHGLEPAGATDVLAALQAGRVEALIVTRDAKLPGTQCRDCDTLVHGTPQTCQHCGSKSVFEVDLVDALARQTQLTSATCEFADEIEGLVEMGNVAALLRY